MAYISPTLSVIEPNLFKLNGLIGRSFSAIF